jgi:signal transduction histidine kinase
VLLPRAFTSIPARYALGFFVAALAVATQVLLSPLLGDYVPYLMLLAAVAFAARFLGLGPSVLTVAAAVVGVRYWLIPPAHAFTIPGLRQFEGMLSFLFAASIIIAFGEMNRRSAEKAHRTREELEVQVRQRTADLDAANKNLRELTGHVLHLQDQERRRISRELHDSAGQLLAVLAMKLSGMKTAAEAQIKALTNTAAAAAEGIALVDETSTQIRTISYLLHPPLLDEAGLGSALRWYVQGFSERSKIAVDLDLPEHFGRLPQDFETAIFRVVQECLTNIVRHSESSVASLRLVRSSSRVRLDVRDKGKGIPPERLSEVTQARTPGVGMRGMRERVQQLGGTLEVKSEGCGKGTLVTAVFPIATQGAAVAVSTDAAANVSGEAGIFDGTAADVSGEVTVSDNVAVSDEVAVSGEVAEQAESVPRGASESEQTSPSEQDPLSLKRISASA